METRADSSDDFHYNPFFDKALKKLMLEEDWLKIMNLIRSSPIVLEAILNAPSEIMKEPLLHLMIEYDETELAMEVMHMMDPEDLLKSRNTKTGDTALHVAVRKENVVVVEALLDINVELMNIRNTYGEFPLHKAALQDNKAIIDVLYRDAEVDQIRSRRNDGATILHCAVMASNYELAAELVEILPDLIFARDQLGMTVLHHVVSNPPDAFRSECQLNMLDSFLYKYIIMDDKRRHSRITRRRMTRIPDEEDPNFGGDNFGLPSMEDRGRHKIYGLMEIHYNRRSFKKLNDLNDIIKYLAELIRQLIFKVLQSTNHGKFLINLKKKNKCSITLLNNLAKNRDYWWVLSSGGNPRGVVLETLRDDKVMQRWMENPLVLAATLGFNEFVTKVLHFYPAAALCESILGKNLLHVAVENRLDTILGILNQVTKYDPRLPNQLRTALDKNGNTILHLAAMCNNKQSSPMQMADEFEWFERTQKMLPVGLEYHRNNNGKTAKEVFVESHESMVEEAKKQLTDTARACCGALVSAVTFAAGFSIANNDNDKKGGKNADDRTKTVLKIFSHTYMIGLSCTAMALLQFMALLMASYKMEDFKKSLPTQYMLAFASLFTAMLSMVVAFGCNTYVGIYNDINTDWRNYLGVAIEVLFFPFICLLVMRCQGISCLPFFSGIRRYLR